MRILLSTYGSRGDVEPLAALAVRLAARGVEAPVSAPGDREFAELLARAGVPFRPAFMPVRQWISEKAELAKRDFKAMLPDIVAGQFASLAVAAEGCDAILATGLLPSAAAALAVAETRGIPYLHVSLCPLYLPSHHHRPVAYPGHPVPPEVTDRRELWAQNAKVLDSLFGEAIDRHRASIGLAALGDVRDRIFTARPLLASEPALSPWRKSDLCDAVQTGAWILRDQRLLPADLAAFLRAGPPPVHIGFGSMAMPAVREAARVAIAAIRAQGRRAIVQRGWADLDIENGEDCLVIGEVNQQALFRRVAAVIHHGGAGTTTTAARAGVPQLIVPQVADQPFWAGRVAELGIGAAHDGPTPSFASLSSALAIALSPQTAARASALAETMRADGAALAADILVEALAR